MIFGKGQRSVGNAFRKNSLARSPPKSTENASVEVKPRTCAELELGSGTPSMKAGFTKSTRPFLNWSMDWPIHGQMILRLGLIDVAPRAFTEYCNHMSVCRSQIRPFRLLILFYCVFALSGCKAGQGDTCEVDGDCADNLQCAPDLTCQTTAAIVGQNDDIELKKAESNDPAMNSALKKSVMGVWVCQTPSAKSSNRKIFHADGRFEMSSHFTSRNDSKWFTETHGKWWINYVKLCLRLDRSRTEAKNEEARKLEKVIGSFPQPFKTGVSFCLDVPHSDEKSLLIDSPTNSSETDICRRPRKGE